MCGRHRSHYTLECLIVVDTRLFFRQKNVSIHLLIRVLHANFFHRKVFFLVFNYQNYAFFALFCSDKNQILGTKIEIFFCNWTFLSINKISNIANLTTANFFVSLHYNLEDTVLLILVIL